MLTVFSSELVLKNVADVLEYTVECLVWINSFNSKNR